VEWVLLREELPTEISEQKFSLMCWEITDLQSALQFTSVQFVVPVSRSVCDVNGP